MSHFVNYAVAFTNTEHIKEALTEMGYRVEEDIKINGWGKEKMHVPIAGIKPRKNEIGFVLNQKTGSYEAVADWMYIPDKQATLNRMAQLNSKYNVQAALKKARFSTKITEKDGEMVLVGTR